MQNLRTLRKESKDFPSRTGQSLSSCTIKCWNSKHLYHLEDGTRLGLPEQKAPQPHSAGELDAEVKMEVGWKKLSGIKSVERNDLQNPSRRTIGLFLEKKPLPQKVIACRDGK